MTAQITTIGERRSGQDRRRSNERRHGPDRRSGGERRSDLFPETGLNVVPITDRIPDGGTGGSSSSWRHGTQPGDLEAFPPRDVVDVLAPKLTSLVAGFYDACMDARFWPDNLDKLRTLLRADVCAVATHDFDAGKGRIEHSCNIDALFVTSYADYYSRCNVWLRNQEQFQVPARVLSGQDLFADSELVETDYYRYWLRPQSLFHHLFGVVEYEANTVTYVTFARSQRQGAFWDDDVAMLGHLLPSMRRALRAGHAYRRTMDLQTIALDTLDALPIGVAFLSSRGLVVAANRMAREIINSEETLFQSSSGLGFRTARGRIRLRDVLGSTPGKEDDHSGETYVVTVPRESHHRPLNVVVQPVRDRAQLRGPNEPVATMFIADPERPVDVDPRWLTRVYGLSRAEARVGALLARGLRLEQVAEHLGLTYETVRKHLKQIFAKTTTDRQAELLRTIATGPCGLRL